MRGYFSIGVEGISKQVNTSSLMRSAHGFGASSVFTIGANYRPGRGKVDTSKGTTHMPLYEWEKPSDMILPKGCHLVGIELLDEAVDLPSFRHPINAAYVLGPERGVLSDEILTRCQHVIKIPTAFCINVGMAGAIVMYDRVVTLGRFPPRPVVAGGGAEPLEEHVHGGRFSRLEKNKQKN